MNDNVEVFTDRTGPLPSSKTRPIVSIKATYGMKGDHEQYALLGATLTAADGLFSVATGTSAGAAGMLRSRRPIVWQPGTGVTCEIDAAFSTPVANSSQGAGMFSLLDGMLFGSKDTEFGVLHRRAGEIEARRIKVGTAATGGGTATITLNGVAYTAAVTAGTKAHNAHEIATALAAGAAGLLWRIQHINESVVIAYRGAGPKAGSYSISSTGGLVGTIDQINAGEAPVDDFITQADWNVDKCAWLDWTKLNFFKFEFCHGQLRWYVFSPDQGIHVLCHVKQWANKNTVPVFRNPSVRVGWTAISRGSTTNLVVTGTSACATAIGDRIDGRPFGVSSTKTNITTRKQILTVGVREEFGSRTCNGVLVPTLLTLSTDSTKGAVFRLSRNPVVAGDTIHQYVDEADSIAIYDTGGTTITTEGRIYPPISVGPSGRTTIDLRVLGIVLVAGEELVITAEVTTGAGAEMTASLGWEELQ